MFLFDILLLLFGAFLGGEIARRLGQITLVGQLLVGVALGPTLLAPYDGLFALGPELTAIQLLGTVFIVFMAGLFIAPGAIDRLNASSTVLGVGIFVVPFSVAAVVARIILPGGDGLLPLFIGVTVSVTALPVMGVMLAELGLLSKPIGALLMSAALVNELIAVSVFSVLLRLTQGGAGVAATASEVGLAALSIAVFLAVVLGIHALLRRLRRTPGWGRMQRDGAQRLRTREAGLVIVMAAALGGSLFSQYLGLTYIVGAFYAGILVSQGLAGLEAGGRVRLIFDTISWGFFLPLFFAFVGVEMNLRLINTVTAVVLLAVLVPVAIVTKVGTGYTIARLSRWSRTDSLVIGQLTSSRGAVELALAVVLLMDHVFTAQVFTVVAAVGLVTTLVAPLGIARLARSGPEPAVPA